jgi:hypothetical protein
MRSPRYTNLPDKANKRVHVMHGGQVVVDATARALGIAVPLMVHGESGIAQRHQLEKKTKRTDKPCRRHFKVSA